MFSNTLLRKRLGKLTLLILCAVFTIAVSAGTGFAAKQKKIKGNQVEVLYYDEASGIKIVNQNNFLLKVERNKKRLKIVRELGPYPAAYPKHLPAPGTHIDSSPDL